MERNKAQNYLNIANKAGYLIIGSDKLDGYKQKLYLVLIDTTAGKSSQKIADRFARDGIETIKIENLPELCDIKTCKILGVKNKELSIKIKDNLVD